MLSLTPSAGAFQLGNAARACNHHGALQGAQLHPHGQHASQSLEANDRTSRPGREDGKAGANWHSPCQKCHNSPSRHCFIQWAWVSSSLLNITLNMMTTYEALLAQYLSRSIAHVAMAACCWEDMVGVRSVLKCMCTTPVDSGARVGCSHM